MTRRPLAAGAAFAAPGASGADPAPPGRETFVLVHGAWHGGWCWRRVADLLRAEGHRVFTPTCTGLGERAHLISSAITLDTFTADIAAVIEAEELSDVILVGHSFGGSPTSGVAARMPERLKHLVYLDAHIVPPGEAPFDSLPPDIVAGRRRAAAESSGGLSLPNPPPRAFGVPEGPAAEWLKRRLTPHPISTYESKLTLDGPVGNNLPRTYIHCTDPSYAPLEGSRQWVKAQGAGWGWLEIATGHDAMVTAPKELARMLVGVGSG